ncbi:hypothetical protein PTHTG4_07790 [Parageobacillus thermoglucosidasius]|uniref:Uncharacterized protein n=1 Tax=Geobacillus sp. (strain Y4.1MC1) TaxID=581103 RepID=A0A7U3YDX9_GEOS0|nr:hypothetical protein Geoth_1062 [Parageobacillus thermoglucosidasius C56-YS93]GCD81717.1 hypothetical protein PTHTG4_07790 [Parageobacillus thermoglucosidasius]
MFARFLCLNMPSFQSILFFAEMGTIKKDMEEEG